MSAPERRAHVRLGTVARSLTTVIRRVLQLVCTIPPDPNASVAIPSLPARNTGSGKRLYPSHMRWWNRRGLVRWETTRGAGRRAAELEGGDK